MITATPQAIVWSLTAPSATGGKEHRIAVIDNVVIVGWGSIRQGTRQFTVTRHRTPTLARQAAQEIATKKIENGYNIAIEPRTFPVTEPMLHRVQQMHGHRGASTALARLTGDGLMHGTAV